MFGRTSVWAAVAKKPTPLPSAISVAVNVMCFHNNNNNNNNAFYFKDTLQDTHNTTTVQLLLKACVLLHPLSESDLAIEQGNNHRTTIWLSLCAEQSEQKHCLKPGFTRSACHCPNIEALPVAYSCLPDAPCLSEKRWFLRRNCVIVFLPFSSGLFSRFHGTSMHSAILQRAMQGWATLKRKGLFKFYCSFIIMLQ